MKVTGIIAEYNPFHNGHLYQIRKARELTGADYVIIVMSGNLMQRGTPALIDKFSRTKMALMGGADMVIELPVCYSCASAEYFAMGAVSILNQLGCVDSICFGSEAGDITMLDKIAHALADESEKFSNYLKDKLKKGETYPMARNAALAETVKGVHSFDSILSSPNNILGIEYIKALLRQNSSIKPYTHERIGSDYHSYKLAENFSSAISIRQSLRMQDNPELIRPQVPADTYQIMVEEFHKTFPIYSGDFSTMIRYKLLKERGQGFTQYFDVSKAISDKLEKEMFSMQSIEEFCDSVKSRDITYARISRCLTHILWDIKTEDIERYKENGITFYARVLGFKEASAALSKAIKAHSSIPMITKVSNAGSVLYPIGQMQLEQDIRAAHLYECIAGTKYHAGMRDEYHRQVIKI